MIANYPPLKCTTIVVMLSSNQQQLLILLLPILTGLRFSDVGTLFGCLSPDEFILMIFVYAESGINPYCI